LTNLREEVLRHSVGKSDYSALPAETQEFVDDIINAGYRNFLFPRPMNGPPHSWSFLHPRATLTLNAAYSTGTVAVSSGVVTLTSGTFPSWAASGVVVISGIGYEVDTRDSGTQVTLVDTSYSVATGTSYVLDQRDYDLPDDFGGLGSGRLVYQAAGNLRKTVEIISEDALVRRRVERIESTTQPFLAAIRYKSQDGTTGQRSQILFAPPPDAAYTLTHTYDVLPNKLTTAAPYPYGGMKYAELIRAACLASAEIHFDSMRGNWNQIFQEQMTSAIAADKQHVRVSFGYLDDRGVSPFNSDPRTPWTYMPDVAFTGVPS
jgi:hypothetical protein